MGWSGGDIGSGRKGGILLDGVVGVDDGMDIACAGNGSNAWRGGGPGFPCDGVAGIGDEGGCGNGCVGGGGAGRMPICRVAECGDERTGVPGVCEANTALMGVIGDGV